MMREGTTQTQFRTLLVLALLATGASALVFLGFGLVVNDRSALLSAGAIGIYAGVLFAARHALAHDRQGEAAWLVSLGLVGAVLVLTVIQPALWVSYAVAPLLAAAVMLQYAPRVPIARAMVIYGLSTALIAALGETLAPVEQRVPLFVSVLRIVSLSTTMAFVLFLLAQFRARLHTMLDALQQRSDDVEARNLSLAETNHRLEVQMTRSAALLTQVLALETPVTTLGQAVLYAPVVGSLTAERAESLRTRLVETAHTQRARWMIVDVQGVLDLDTRVAADLHATFEALTLVGCRVCLCGIRAPVASVLSEQGLAFANVITVRSPQEALLVTQQRGPTSVVGAGSRTARTTPE
jgi:anti-anti-sigma regulatory factor